MPVSISKASTVSSGYRVSTPHGVKAKHTSMLNAMRQKRLLEGVEHGWKPTGAKPKKKKKKVGGY